MPKQEKRREMAKYKHNIRNFKKEKIPSKAMKKITAVTRKTLLPIEIIKRAIEEFKNKGLNRFTTDDVVDYLQKSKAIALMKNEVKRILELLAVRSNDLKEWWYTKDYWEELKKTAKRIYQNFYQNTKCEIPTLAAAIGIAEKDTENILIETGLFKKCDYCGKVKPSN